MYICNGSFFHNQKYTIFIKVYCSITGNLLIFNYYLNKKYLSTLKSLSIIFLLFKKVNNQIINMCLKLSSSLCLLKILFYSN